jgi:hypothetical protein
MAAAASVAFVPSAAANPYQDADYLRTLTATMARHRYELGGTPLAPKALSHSQRVLGAVENSRDRDLQAAASAFLNQATLILYDAGRLSPAERLGGRSLDLATRSADTEGQARAYDALSRVSLYRGDSSRAVMYARRGLRIRGITDVQRALLNMRLGRSLALVPERGDDSMAALETALTLGAPSPFGKAALGGDVGIGLGVLGRYREAGSLLREAADSMGRRSPLFRAQYLGRQAQTALRAADPSLAAVHIHAFARAVPLVTSARVGRRAQEIFRASDAWRTVPELGQARDHLRTVLPAA